MSRPQDSSISEESVVYANNDKRCFALLPREEPGSDILGFILDYVEVGLSTIFELRAEKVSDYKSAIIALEGIEVNVICTENPKVARILKRVNRKERGLAWVPIEEVLWNIITWKETEESENHIEELIEEEALR